MQPSEIDLLCSEVSDQVISVVDQEDHYNSNNNEDEDEEENNSSNVLSYFDPAVLNHPEILERLKYLETKLPQPKGYYQSIVGDKGDSKYEILPFMRKVVGSWMLEVCEEQQCDEAVFPLSISLLDQFLSDCLISKEQVQLAACVCLLLASKTRQCNHFSLELLSWYTDNSVSPQSLRTWELAMLSHFNWDVNIITAMDFVDVLLNKSPTCKSNTKHGNVVRRHATTFIALCSTEPRFVGVRPSLVAASAIHAAARGLRLDDEKNTFAILLSSLISVTKEQLETISGSIEQVIATEIKVMEQQHGPNATSTPIKKARSSSLYETQISEEVLV